MASKPIMRENVNARNTLDLTKKKVIQSGNDVGSESHNRGTLGVCVVLKIPFSNTFRV